MHILWLALIGLFIGVLAKWILPGRAPHGMVLTSLLGLTGAVLAAVVGRAGGWYAPHEPAGFLASVLGAIGVLAIYRTVVRAREAACACERGALDE